MSKRQLGIRLPLHLFQKLDAQARAEGVSRTHLSFLLLAAAIASLPDPGPGET